MAQPKQAQKEDWLSIIQKMSPDPEISGIASRLAPVRENMIVLPSVSLNWALGGGIAERKFAMFYGPESSGKTLLAYLTVLALQQQAALKGEQPKFVVWYDAELSGFDPEYASKLGINCDFVWVIKDNLSAAIFDHFTDKVYPMVQKGFPCSGFVIDSVRSIVGPKESNLESVSDHVMGDLSTLLPKALKRMLRITYLNKMRGIFVQQVGEELDPQKQKVGIKYRIPGGKALVHHMDYIVLTERVDSKSSRLYTEEFNTIGDLPLQIGHTVRCKVQKNRVSAPYRVAEFQLQYGVGVVNVPLELVKLGLGLRIIQRPNQQTYAFGDLSVRGIDNFVRVIGERPELQRDIQSAIYSFDPKYQDFTARDSDAAIVADDGTVIDTTSSARPDID